MKNYFHEKSSKALFVYYIIYYILDYRNPERFHYIY